MTIQKITHVCALCGRRDDEVKLEFHEGRFICTECPKVRIFEVDSRDNNLEFKDRVEEQ